VGPYLVLVLVACGATEIVVRRSGGQTPLGRARALIPTVVLHGAALGGLGALAWVALKVGGSLLRGRVRDRAAHAARRHQRLPLGRRAGAGRALAWRLASVVGLASSGLARPSSTATSWPVGRRRGLTGTAAG
jgi:hypothetical protein